MQRWSRETGLAWDNTKDSMVKTIQCPRCGIPVDIPWTTCEFPDQNRSDVEKGLYDPGNGYGDGYLHFPCPSCNIIICKELLTVAKFVRDHDALLGQAGRPMPGTVLDPVTGTPTKPTPNGTLPQYTFPNRMLKSDCTSIRSNIANLLLSGSQRPSMKDVRALIEKVTRDMRNIKQIEGIPQYNTYQLPLKSRMAIRKMMSRYWENFSPFALELGGAVMRQGIFIEKMCQLDWLHSSTALETMNRLIVKYTRFIKIMADNPGKSAAPTLDVDLAWHTHQLNPERYYSYTVGLAGRFIDHDDKVDGVTLGEQFEWTTKVYQELYGEVYSECICWYCECKDRSLSSPRPVLLVACD